MRTRRGSSTDDPSTHREAWRKTFKDLISLVQDKQRQLEYFVKEGEKRIQGWEFEVKLLKDRISMMKRDSKIKDMTRFVEAAKADLILSMKQTEATMNKLKFEEAEDERADLKLLFDDLSQSSAEPKRVTRSNSKDIDQSFLKAELDFAWNQFKKTDAKLQEHIKRTKSETGIANEKIHKLISDLEQSQSLNMEKNKTIESLQDDIAVLESDSRKKSEEISRLMKEVELLKGESNRAITPVLRRCQVESGKGKSNSSELSIVEKGVRSSKRKTSETTPRLFTSRFKVPKLKNNSSPL